MPVLSLAGPPGETRPSTSSSGKKGSKSKRRSSQVGSIRKNDSVPTFVFEGEKLEGRIFLHFNRVQSEVHSFVSQVLKVKPEVDTFLSLESLTGSESRRKSRGFNWKGLTFQDGRSKYCRSHSVTSPTSAPPEDGALDGEGSTPVAARLEFYNCSSRAIAICLHTYVQWDSPNP
jgi:hypothetical protein